MERQHHDANFCSVVLSAMTCRGIQLIRAFMTRSLTVSSTYRVQIVSCNVLTHSLRLRARVNIFQSLIMDLGSMMSTNLGLYITR